MFASVFWGSSIFSIKCFCLEAKQAQRYGSSTSVYYCKFNQFSGRGVYDVHSSNSWQQQNWPSFPLKPCSIILRSKELNPLSTVQKLCNLEQSQQHFLLLCITGTHAGGSPALCNVLLTTQRNSTWQPWLGLNEVGPQRHVTGFQ